jgi:hypothetical protein
VTEVRELSSHRRLRRERGKARVLVRLGQAAGLLSRHHSRQHPVDMGYWVCSCKSWSWDVRPKCHSCGKAKPANVPKKPAAASSAAGWDSYADAVRGWSYPKPGGAKPVPQPPVESASQWKRRAKAGGGGVPDHAAALATLRGDGDPATVALVAQLEEALKCARTRKNDDKPIPQRMSELEKSRTHKVRTLKKADDLVVANPGLYYCFWRAY